MKNKLINAYKKLVDGVIRHNNINSLQYRTAFLSILHTNGIKVMGDITISVFKDLYTKNKWCIQ